MSKLFLNRIVHKKGPPIHLVWFVTSRCNLSCGHCFFHSEINSERSELNLNEISKTIDNLSPLLSLSLTGGEPFLRNDLSEIARILSEKKISQNLLLYSNGFNTNSVLEGTEKIVRYCRNMRVSIGISIDGFEKDHDRYRNVKGAFERALRTLRGLKKISSSYKNLNVGANVTLHRENQSIVGDLRKYINDVAGVNLGVTIIRGEPKCQELVNIDKEVCRDVMKSIEKESNNCKKNIFQSLVNTRVALGHKMALDTFVYGRRNYECYAGSLMGIIYDNGDIFPCEMLPSARMGNLRDYDYDIKKIWSLPESEEVRELIKKKTCFCTYECQYTCNTLYNIKFLPVFMKNVIKDIIIS